jgi:hypothetical protein
MLLCHYVNAYKTTKKHPNKPQSIFKLNIFTIFYNENPFIIL